MLTSSFFVGDTNSREKFVKDVAEFINKSNVPGYVRVFGAYGIGKTRAIEHAINAAKKGKPDIDLCDIVSLIYGPLDPERVAEAVAQKLSEDPPKIRRRKARMEILQEWTEVVTWIDKKLKSRGRAATVVICLPVSRVDDSHVELGRLFSTQDPGIGARKFILEQQTATAKLIDWRQERQEHALRAFTEQESGEFIDSCLESFLVSPELSPELGKTARKLILHNCGHHPGLIEQFCRLLGARGPRHFRDGEELTKYMANCMDSDKPVLCGYVGNLVNSLSDGAKEALAKREIHQELWDAGIITGEAQEVAQFASLIKRCFPSSVDQKSDRNKDVLREIIDELMAIQSVLIRYPDNPLGVHKARLAEALKAVEGESLAMEKIQDLRILLSNAGPGSGPLEKLVKACDTILGE